MLSSQAEDPASFARGNPLPTEIALMGLQEQAQQDQQLAEVRFAQQAEIESQWESKALQAQQNAEQEQAMAQKVRTVLLARRSMQEMYATQVAFQNVKMVK